jgi:hypothetical protein
MGPQEEQTAASIISSSRALLGEKETYRNAFDLIHLHSRVASAFALDREYVPLIEKDISECNDEAIKVVLERQRDILSNGTRWKWFYQDIKEHLRTWMRRDVTDNELFSSVRQYIEVLRNYFGWISIVWESSITRVCAHCGATVMDGRGCSLCGDTESAKEKDVIKKKRNTGGSVDNFIRCIKSIIVSKCESLPVSVTTALDEFATGIGMYTGGEIRSMSLDEHGYRGPYNISDLMEMLKATKNTDYYPEKWWVAKNYWGWEPHILDPSVEEEIKRDCATVFSLYANESSTNGSINREWLALRLLLNHKDKLHRTLLLDDFDIIKTPEIREAYESRWQSFCEKNPAWNACPIYGSWDIDGR